MSKKHEINVRASAADRAAAALDRWEVVNESHPKRVSRGWQMGLGMVDAVLKNTAHPMAGQIVKSAERLGA